MSEKRPKHYQKMKKAHPEFIAAVETLGKTVHEAGPLEEKQVLLIQLGAAAAMHSEGSVISHAKRAAGAGASREEIDHAIICLTSTIGFPAVAAALAWVDKELD